MASEKMNLLTIEELAAYLKIKPGSVRYLLYNKKIPRVKIGRVYRFVQDEIDQWIRNENEPPRKFKT